MKDPTNRLERYPATRDDAVLVLNDLSTDERIERERLGLDPAHPLLFKEVEEHRAFALLDTLTLEPLAIFGVTKEGMVWFLPRQHFIDHYKRQLANKKIIQWVIDFMYEFARENGIETPVLFNGVTPENAPIIAWLDRAVGARFHHEALPTQKNGHKALPFFIPKEAGRV